MINKLFSNDLAGVISWIRGFIALYERGELSIASEGETTSSGLALGTGSLIVVAGDVPDGWIEADNSLQFTNVYPDLYTVVGLTFDAAPPAGMFRLPSAPSVLVAGLKWIVKT